MARQVAILAVIVLYKRKLDQSPALRSLRASLMRLARTDDVRLKILIYENESDRTYITEKAENIEVYSSSNNGGLAAAYNYALEKATMEGFEWLLTLDQDSTLPEPFLPQLVSILGQISGQEEIAGVVPQVVSREHFISPHLLKQGRSIRLPAGFVGVAEGEVSAINSGMTWRTSVLKGIGGFNVLFWLDYLDHWLFREIQLSGKRIYVAGDIQVEHELSLLNRGTQLSADRLENILAAECAFCDLYQDWRGGLAKTAGLSVRLGKLFIRGDTHLTRVTWHCLKSRLFVRRNTRVTQWRNAVSDRIGRLPSGTEE